MTEQEVKEADAEANGLISKLAGTIRYLKKDRDMVYGLNKNLSEQLAAAQADNAALRDRAANQHCAELLREVKATGERNAEPQGRSIPAWGIYRHAQLVRVFLHESAARESFIQCPNWCCRPIEVIDNPPDDPPPQPPEPEKFDPDALRIIAGLERSGLTNWQKNQLQMAADELDKRAANKK